MDAGLIAFFLAAVFVASAQGIELSITDIVTVLLLVSVGSMGIHAMPNPKLSIVLMVYQQLPYSMAGFAPLIVAEDLVADRVGSGRPSLRLAGVPAVVMVLHSG